MIWFGGENVLREWEVGVGNAVCHLRLEGDVAENT
jgi:hypothetical protein